MQGRLGKKQAKQNHRPLIVSIRQVATADAKERLSRAVDMLLMAVPRHAALSRRIMNIKRRRREGPRLDSDDNGGD